MSTTSRVITNGVLLLALALIQASCGARTGFGSSEGDGSAPPDPFGGPDPSLTPSAPTSLPCTLGNTTALGGAERMRIGPCQWHSADPADLAHPDLKFIQVGDGTSIPLSLVDGPGRCDSASGHGWYLVPNVPGVIVEAPVVMTFEVCPAACKEVMSGQGWLLSFKMNTCQ